MPIKDEKLSTALKAYAKRLNFAIKQDPAYRIFSQAKDIDIKNLTPKQIANLTKKLNETEFDTTKKEKFGNIIVSSDALNEMKRKVKDINKAHAEIRKLYPEVTGTKILSIRKARWSDVDIGTGENETAFAKRLESIKNYSSAGKFIEEGAYYRSAYINNLRENLGPYAERIISLLPKDGNVLYALAQSEEFGDYLSQEFLYTDDDMIYKAQNIENALRSAYGMNRTDYSRVRQFSKTKVTKNYNEAIARTHDVNYFSATEFVNNVYNIFRGF